MWMIYNEELEDNNWLEQDDEDSIGKKYVKELMIVLAVMWIFYNEKQLDNS